MTIRSRIGDVVTRVPWLPGLVVRLWAARGAPEGSAEHALFSRVKSRLGCRVRRRVRLVTGQPMEVDPFDVVGGAIAREGAYEPDTVALWRALVAPGMVVADVGAHAGQYTILASPLVGAGGSVHAFEPDPETFRLLVDNVTLNRCANVACANAALAREPGTARLYLADVSNVGGSSLRPTVCYRGRQRDVRVETLDGYAAARALGRLDLLKIDVEGAELLVLDGGAGLVERSRPLMILEFSINAAAFGYTEATLRSRLAGWGYRLYTVGPTPLAELTDPPPGVDFYNVLAVPSPRAADLAARGIVRP
jgi:FkbM family methyltransferase